MAKFRKGKSGNPNGRPKGAQNKTSAEIKQAIGEIVTTELNDLPQRLESLPDLQRIEMLTKLLPYVIGKVKETPTNDETEEQIQTCIVLPDGQKIFL